MVTTTHAEAQIDAYQDAHTCNEAKVRPRKEVQGWRRMSTSEEASCRRRSLVTHHPLRPFLCRCRFRVFGRAPPPVLPNLSFRDFMVTESKFLSSWPTQYCTRYACNHFRRKGSGGQVSSGKAFLPFSCQEWPASHFLHVQIVLLLQSKSTAQNVSSLILSR